MPGSIIEKSFRVHRNSAVAFYAFCLVVILFVLARGNPAIGASVLALTGTMGDLRVSRSKPKISPTPNLLRRTFRRVGGQVVLLALVLLDIGWLGLALSAPGWLAPWGTINLAALMFGTLNWSEDRRAQRESATAVQRQAEKLRAAEQLKLEDRKHEAERQQQAEQAERLREAEQQLREAEERLDKEEERRKAERQQEQAERLHQAEQRLREAEERRCLEEVEREVLRQQHAQQAERLRQLERQLIEAEDRLRKAEERREAEPRRRREKAQRKRQGKRKKATDRFKADWWSVLGVAPSASKDEIMRNFRRMVKQCHPDRVIGLAPEFIELAEEHTKTLNEAYENAMRCRRGTPVC